MAKRKVPDDAALSSAIRRTNLAWPGGGPPPVMMTRAQGHLADYHVFNTRRDVTGRWINNLVNRTCDDEHGWVILSVGYAGAVSGVYAADGRDLSGTFPGWGDAHDGIRLVQLHDGQAVGMACWKNDIPAADPALRGRYLVTRSDLVLMLDRAADVVKAQAQARRAKADEDASRFDKLHPGARAAFGALLDAVPELSRELELAEVNFRIIDSVHRSSGPITTVNLRVTRDDIDRVTEFLRDHGIGADS